MIPHFLPEFLPGRLVVDAGNPADYGALARFHYLAKRPATWAAVSVVRYLEDRRPDARPRVVGIGVLSYPSALHRARQRTFGVADMKYGERLRWANANVRTISRVIVHPQFRALGLARLLIESLCARCPTPLIESSARMGRAHPMFERAGFFRVEPIAPDEPIYFWRPLSDLRSPSSGTSHANPSHNPRRVA